MDSYIIKSNDCDLQVYARGNIHAPVMMFLHGGPGSGASALFELPAFQAFEDTYCCIYFDQRGSGKSHYDLQKGLTITQICKDVKLVIKDTMKRYGCQHVILWGGSYGGTLACLYMQHDGEDVSALVLNNPAITFDRSQGIAFYERMKEASLQRMPANMRPTSLETLNPEKEMNDAKFISFVFSSYNPSNSLRHICAMSSWFFNTSFKEALSALSIPSLLMLGKEDPICANKDTITVVEKLKNPHIECKVLSPCGHAIFEDLEEKFVSLTKRYLENI